MICPWCQGDALVPDGSPLPQAPLAWTKERPTTPGWYWRSFKGKNPEPVLIDADLRERGEYSYRKWSHDAITNMMLWAGPITPPPLPMSYTDPVYWQ